ncbi:DUF1653 domain-containing protein [Curtobacterium flaccumfaciens]|uniref:DUF1653 domain-containing protein n=1 Tax=Curtobacterium flaccumfaciens TaxID=2035 RepID=UPI001E29B6A6|nr:DUF1653 domain-containing protein [Curtobacterium allii]MCE0456938.1 DUF1653 domain-containing protein [Curtobacterium allii]
MSDDVTPGRYRHFKGNDYEVLLVARDVETEEPVVVYQALYGERGHWVRTLADFTAHVTSDGYEGVRFLRMEPRRLCGRSVSLNPEPEN